MSERLRVVLEFDDGGFVKGVEANNDRLKRFGKNIIAVDNKLKEVEKSAGSWGRRLKDTAVTLASLNYLIPNLTNVLFGWQRSIIAANAELEQSVAIMKNFSTEISETAAELEARNFVDMITQKAAAAPFSIDALTDSIVKMKAAGLDNAEQGFNALVDAVAAFGGTDVTLKRASVAISQMSGKGVVSMEELRQQLGEAVPSAINIMATSLQTTYSELVKEISKGNVRSDIALVAMFEEMERQLGGSAVRMMETWNGLMAQLSTATTVNLRVFGEEGYFKAIKEQLQNIIVLLNEPSTQRFMADLSRGMADVVKWLSEAAKWVYENKDAILLLGASYLAFSRVTSGSLLKVKGAYDSISGSLNKYIEHKQRVDRVSQQVFQKEYKRLMDDDSIRSRHHTAIMQRHNQAVLSGTAADRQFIMSSQKKANALAIERHALEAKDLAMKKSMITMKRYSASARIMRGALAGIPGILISIGEVVATTFLVKWVTGWGEAEEAVRKNIEALKEYKGLYADAQVVADNEKELKRLQEEEKRIEGLLKKRAQLEGQLQKQVLDGVNASGRTGNLSQSTLKAMAELKELEGVDTNALERVRTRIGEISRDLLTATNLTVKSIKEQQERTISINVSNIIDEAQRSYKKTIKEVSQQLKDISGDESLSKEQKAEKQNIANALIDEAVIKLVEQRITAFKGQRERLAKELEDLTKSTSEGGKGLSSTDVEVVGLTQSLADLDNKIAEMSSTEGRRNLKDALLNGQDLKDVADVKRYLTMVEDRLNSLNGEIKEFENRSSASGGEFEKFLATLGDAAKHSDIQGKLDEIKLKMEQVYANDQFLKAESSFDKFIAKLGEVEQASRAAFSEKSSQSLSLTTKHATKYQITMQGLIKDINEYIAAKDADKAAEMIRQLAQGKSIAQMQDMSALYTEITNKNLRLEEQLGKQSEGQEAYYDGLIANAESILGALNREAEGYDKTSAALTAYIENLKQMKAIKGESKDVLLDHIKDWDDLELAIGNVQTNALDGFVDVLTNGLTGASMSFKDFADSIIKDITRMIVKFMVMKAITGAMGMFGGGSGADGMHSQGMGMDSNGGAITFGGHLDPTPFANGGIMTSAGSLPLKKYANGGIANSPQLALFGEGRMNEAYVPLPDGRTIPVTMKGGSGDVQVNIYNQGGQRMEGESSTRFDGEKMVVDVMLKHINQPGRVRESIRGV